MSPPPDEVRFGPYRLDQMRGSRAVLHLCEGVGGLRYGEAVVGQETVMFESDAADK